MGSNGQLPKCVHFLPILIFGIPDNLLLEKFTRSVRDFGYVKKSWSLSIDLFKYYAFR